MKCVQYFDSCQIRRRRRARPFKTWPTGGNSATLFCCDHGCKTQKISLEKRDYFFPIDYFNPIYYFFPIDYLFPIYYFNPIDYFFPKDYFFLIDYFFPLYNFNPIDDFFPLYNFNSIDYLSQ